MTDLSKTKAVILAGGFGKRISEESVHRPKPMVEIGGEPILWHIMKSMSHFGIRDFIICLGYKGNFIKEYFRDYAMRHADVTFDLAANTLQLHNQRAEPWRVTLVDTGLQTMTGGRLKRLEPWLENESEFIFTYGDAVTDANLHSLMEFHRAQGKIATVTTVPIPGRFGTLQLSDNLVESFEEKPAFGGGWINGGFFVLKPEVFNYIRDDASIWEREPVTALARKGELAAYRHTGFWQCMDNVRDRDYLEDIWQEGQAPWKLWNTAPSGQESQFSSPATPALKVVG